jgi:N-acetyl-anhydromuramyl-L-alanine amidase AmpD
VRLVVIHTAQGSTSFTSLGAYFSNPSSGVSSHTGIDDTPGVIGEYVQAVSGKAWTQGNANPYSVATELCAWAEWSAAEWAAHPQIISNCAQWVAEECARFGIPLRRLSANEAQSGAAGVCDHAALGAAGGGHWDVGNSFPWDSMMAQAGGGAPPATQKRKGRNMIASTSTGKGYWTVTHDGAVGAFGDAEYHGGGFSPDVITGEVVGIAGDKNTGYWLMASDGGIFCFGSAQMYGRPDRA